MTQEDKELLLKDLCARLPYGVKCTTKSSWNGIYTIEGYKDNRVFLDCPVYDKGDDEWMIESIVPYLRPMSSMTGEEKEELEHIMGESVIVINEKFSDFFYVEDIYQWDNLYGATDWLNSHHFDYRGLTKRGLALEVTPDNNPYE